ncbi:hypothetical protein EYR40_003162 [Pleurotus pulmonarius]|nr:hypothetical protein EYR40_003162 [Pleurotus pulmonarius]
MAMNFLSQNPTTLQLNSNAFNSHVAAHGLGLGDQVRSLRPSIEAFRRFGWIPQPDAYEKWMQDLKSKILPVVSKMPAPGVPYGSKKDAPELLAPIQEFKEFIEGNAVVYTDMLRMFKDMDQSFPKCYNEMLLVFNEIFRQAPLFGSLGPPMYMIMAKVMNTEGGFSAFTKESLNLHFKKTLQTWQRFLSSKDSTSVLSDQLHNGWFTNEALEALMKDYPGRAFEQVFVCDPTKEAWGFTSFDDFFVRRYREPSTDRPIEDFGDPDKIGASCESAFYAVQYGVKETDELFIKDEAYSLVHLLAGDESVESFIGGSIIQSFLDTNGYHRWHAPVSGIIEKIVDVPGTYFAQAPSLIGPQSDAKALPPFLQSLQFFANTAARQLIFIKADNDKIGLMCFIAIGMTEISTCQATVHQGQHVDRGDELGMFHFGGSSNAMVFRKDANVRFDPEYTRADAHIRINTIIGAVTVS